MYVLHGCAPMAHARGWRRISLTEFRIGELQTAHAAIQAYQMSYLSVVPPSGTHPIGIYVTETSRIGVLRFGLPRSQLRLFRQGTLPGDDCRANGFRGKIPRPCPTSIPQVGLGASDTAGKLGKAAFATYSTGRARRGEMGGPSGEISLPRVISPRRPHPPTHKRNARVGRMYGLASRGQKPSQAGK